MKQKLLKYGITTVYHFTDRGNMISILADEFLLPRSAITSSYTPGGNEISIKTDNRCGMDKYIHLCFLNKHPMEHIAREEGRIDSVWLEVSTEILDFEGVLYSPGVSNKTGMFYYDNDQARSQLDLDILYKHIPWDVDDNMQRRKDAEKYEILVPLPIPVSLITGVN